LQSTHSTNSTTHPSAHSWLQRRRQRKRSYVQQSILGQTEGLKVGCGNENTYIYC
jgi:hypothetical protein